jgi:hypothetical protein
VQEGEDLAKCPGVVLPDALKEGESRPGVGMIWLGSRSRQRYIMGKSSINVGFYWIIPYKWMF